MKFYVFVLLCLIIDFVQLIISIEIRHSRDPKLLFGGYRITPRFCKPTKKILNDTGGPNICMFNHECIQRQGELVGACMDGFLFGACCHLASGTAGELIQNATKNSYNVEGVTPIQNKPMITHQSRPPVDITSNGIHHITQTLLNPNVLQTIDNNAIVQINGNENEFSTTGILHHHTPDTSIVNTEGLFTPSGYVTKKPTTESRKTTSGAEMSTVAYEHSSPLLTVSVSSPSYTTRPITTTFIRPMFHQKPSDTNKYVLVPTITKPNDQTSEKYPVIHLLENDATTKRPSYTSSSNKPLSTSYVYGSSTTMFKPHTSKKPPSTSYVFSSTIPPRRTTNSQSSTIKLKPTTTKNKTTKPSKTSNKKTKKPSQRPSQSTYTNTPNTYQTTKKPQSTSYIYSSAPTRRPGSTIGVEGPGLSVSAEPIPPYSNNVGYPSPAPTLIVLGPVTDDSLYTVPISHSSPSQYPSTYPASTYQTTGTKPPRKPINHVTINNHVTQNIFPGTRPSSVPPSSLGYIGSSERPSPTVLITPKPSISSSSVRPTPSDEYITASINVEPSVDQLSNFPPVRNPNLNMSQYGENDVTTPEFIEDDILNDKMESFVNKIVQGLQEPFQDLTDIVYNRNKTKPIKKQGITTKKPVAKPSKPAITSRPSRPSSVRPSLYTKPSQSYTKPSPSRPSNRPGTSSSRPSAKPTSSRPISSRPTQVRPLTTVRVTTRRPTRRPSNPSSGITTKRTSTPSKKPSKATRRPTTTESLIEKDTLSPAVFTDDYRRECGRRPLVKTGRIVGGREAKFGEWPWQVLVRESTWLGLFTKNKCGGVLISNRYVLTAAHCQPGFLASLVAVFGEFDISGDLETKRAVSRNVKRVIVNRGYDPQTFENDLALLELESPIPFDQHIIPICLPRENEDFTGRLATVTGWGRLKYNGGVPSVLQEVQVPIMENSVCQEMFRTAAHSKIILDSFLCAGYANGQKDSCEGDSGGPLVLQRSDGRYQLAGTVSHGVKCASPYLPGVYMRTQWFKPWIVSITGIN